jgi:hypothetical protein
VNALGKELYTIDKNYPYRVIQ